jgi:hypothetical protein
VCVCVCVYLSLCANVCVCLRVYMVAQHTQLTETAVCLSVSVCVCVVGWLVFFLGGGGCSHIGLVTYFESLHQRFARHDDASVPEETARHVATAAADAGAAVDQFARTLAAKVCERQRETDCE